MSISDDIIYNIQESGYIDGQVEKMCGIQMMQLLALKRKTRASGWINLEDIMLMQLASHRTANSAGFNLYKVYKVHKS